MPARLTVAECKARYAALEEAAEHLQQIWTEDPIEREQGLAIAVWLNSKADQWLRESVQREESL